MADFIQWSSVFPPCLSLHLSLSRCLTFDLICASVADVRPDGDTAGSSTCETINARTCCRRNSARYDRNINLRRTALHVLLNATHADVVSRNVLTPLDSSTFWGIFSSVYLYRITQRVMDEFSRNFFRKDKEIGYCNSRVIWTRYWNFAARQKRSQAAMRPLP